MIEPGVIDALVEGLQEDQQHVMATVIRRIDDVAEITDPNVVKVVIDKQLFAIYFSRAVIPYNMAEVDHVYYKHLGIYAYRQEFLHIYAALPKTVLETVECLEQLRAVEHGYKIKTVLTEYDSIGVDTPADLVKVTALLKERGA